MHVLVTGGCGFIGSHLTHALACRGDEVAVVDDLSRGRIERLVAPISIHQVSVAELKELVAVICQVRPEIIFHLAAQVDLRSSVMDPARDAQTNILGTVNVLEAARVAGAQVIFASTGGAMYGAAAQVPSSEDLSVAPQAPYGTSKYCGEEYIRLYNRTHRTRHSILRLSNVYGPHQNSIGESGVISAFCKSALRGDCVTVYGDGSQTRDFVYVSDVVEAFLAAAHLCRAGTWNIGTGVETSVIELMRLVEQLNGDSLRIRFSPARPGELQRSALSVVRAQHDLGWVSTVPILAGITKVYRWMQGSKPEMQDGERKRPSTG